MFSSSFVSGMFGEVNAIFSSSLKSISVKFNSKDSLKIVNVIFINSDELIAAEVAMIQA